MFNDGQLQPMDILCLVSVGQIAGENAERVKWNRVRRISGRGLGRVATS